MQPAFNHQALGTTGLPVFGAKAIAPGREGVVTEVEAAYNNLIALVKKYTIPGNEGMLYGYGISLEQTWGLAFKAIAGKGVVNG